jgi:hypothetical protein
VSSASIRVIKEARVLPQGPAWAPLSACRPAGTLCCPPRTAGQAAGGRWRGRPAHSGARRPWRPSMPSTGDCITLLHSVIQLAAGNVSREWRSATRHTIGVASQCAAFRVFKLRSF